MNPCPRLCALCLVTAFAVSSPLSGRAEEMPPAAIEAVAPPAPSANVTSAEPGLSLYGLFDAYYGFNFNRPSPTQAAPGPNGIVPLAPPQNGGVSRSLRTYDLYHNQIALNLFELGIKKTSREFTLQAELDFGELADVQGQTAPSGEDDVSKHIGQVILSYTPEALPRLTVKAGKFYCPMAYETIKAKDSWQYSHSYLFTLGLPAWHVGVTASYAWQPGVFSTLAGVFNGWNSLYDNNSGKTLFFQANWNPTPAMSFFYNVISGPEQPDDNGDRKTVNEAVFSWTLSPKTTVALDLIAGMSDHEILPATGTFGDASWKAAELIGHYAVTARYSINPRIEVYTDPDGYTSGTAQVLRDATLTQSLMLSPELETRLELRYDESDAAVFLANDGARRNQVTGSLAALYWF